MFKTTCPKCNAKLQFPLLTSQATMVRCPVCKQTFHPATGTQFPQRAQVQKNYGKFVGIAISGLIVLALFSCLARYLTQDQRVSSNHNPFRPRPRLHPRRRLPTLRIQSHRLPVGYTPITVVLLIYRT